jgi:hypothetical protein
VVLRAVVLRPRLVVLRPVVLRLVVLRAAVLRPRLAVVRRAAVARPPFRPAAFFRAVVPPREDELRVVELLRRLLVLRPLEVRRLVVLLGVDALRVVLRLVPAVVLRAVVRRPVALRRVTPLLLLLAALLFLGGAGGVLTGKTGVLGSGVTGKTVSSLELPAASLSSLPDSADPSPVVQSSLGLLVPGWSSSSKLDTKPPPPTTSWRLLSP